MPHPTGFTVHSTQGWVIRWIAFSLILAMFFTPLAYKVFADWTQREETE